MAHTEEALAERALAWRGASPDREQASLGRIPAGRLRVVAA